MLKAIKSKFTKTYLDLQGNWVEDVSYARKFATSAELVIFAEEKGLKWYDVEEIEIPPVRTFSNEATPKPREVIFNNGNVPPG